MQYRMVYKGGNWDGARAWQRHTSELSQTLSQRPPTLTDANDAESAEIACLLTLTDAHRRNYSPPEPKVVGSSQSLALARDLDAPAVAPLRPWRRIPPGVFDKLVYGRPIGSVERDVSMSRHVMGATGDGPRTLIPLAGRLQYQRPYWG